MKQDKMFVYKIQYEKFFIVRVVTSQFLAEYTGSVCLKYNTYITKYDKKLYINGTVCIVFSI